MKMKRGIIAFFFVFVMAGICLAPVVSAYKPPPSYPQFYALVVGISDYQDSTGIPDLLYADDDANDWYDLLDILGFTIRVLGDDTSEYPWGDYFGLAIDGNIKSQLNWLRTIARPHDTVVVTFSGHGYRSSGWNGGFVDWAGQYFDDDELASYLDDCLAQHIFVFLDFCHSGVFLDDLDNMRNDDYVLATSAVRYDGIARESTTLQNGVWTYFYLDWFTAYGYKSHEWIYSHAYQSLTDYYASNPPPGYDPLKDRPQLFDGNPSAPFYIQGT